VEEVTGIRYVLDDKGVPEMVIIDLKKHRRVWEDLQDLLVARDRQNEPRVSHKKVVDELRRQGRMK